MLESEIETYLVERVKAAGGEVRKVKWIGRHGAPDRLVLLPAEFNGNWERSAIVVFVELKAPGKPLEEHQAREHKRMRGFGARVIVIDSKEGVDALLL